MTEPVLDLVDFRPMMVVIVTQPVRIMETVAQIRWKFVLSHQEITWFIHQLDSQDLHQWEQV